MKINAAARGRARHFAMQALYQWEMSGNPVNVVEASFHSDNDMSKVDVEYFSELLHGVAAKKTDLDAVFEPYLTDLSLADVDPVSLAILRLSCFEMTDRVDVPYKVVINEALNVAKKYGAADSHKFINGVLDKVAAKVRMEEVHAVRRG